MPARQLSGTDPLCLGCLFQATVITEAHRGNRNERQQTQASHDGSSLLGDGRQEPLDQVVGIDLVSAGVEVEYEPVA